MPFNRYRGAVVIRVEAFWNRCTSLSSCVEITNDQQVSIRSCGGIWYQIYLMAAVSYGLRSFFFVR